MTTKRLDELCNPERSICYGIVQPGTHNDQGKPIIRVKDLKGDRVDISDVMRVDEDIEAKYRRSRVQENDVLVSLVGSMGQVAIAGAEIAGWNIARAVGLLPVPDRHHAEWIRYSLQSREAQDFINNHANTTVQSTFNLRDLARLPIPYPDQKTRTGILLALKTLDDKIELNRKTAATLEEMARALYRSWFFDFDPVHARSQGLPPAHMPPTTAALFPNRFGDDGLPNGWNAGTLLDLSTLNSKKYSKKSHPETLDYVDLSNTKWGLIETTTPYSWEDAPSRAKMILSAGDTIVGTVRPGNGSYSYIGFNGLTGSTGFAVLSPKEIRDSALVYLAATDTDTIETLTNLADGGAYPAVRPDVVAAQSVCIASDKVRSAFSEQTQPFLEKVEASKLENQTLATLRDSLLPRLMSGELRVGEARKLAEGVV